MVSNRHSHDAVNDVLRLTARCKGSDSEWVKFRKLAEDKDTDPDYGRMLAIILSKADEHRNKESNNINGGVGIHIKREAGASGSKLKPKRLRVEKLESPLENKRRGSDVRGLQNYRKLKGKIKVKEGTEDTKATVGRVRGQVGRVGSGENSALFRKCAANNHLDDRNAEVGPGEKSSLFRKRAAKDHLDRNAKLGLGDNSSFSNKYAAKDHLDRNAKLGLGDNSSFSNKYAAKDHLDRNAKLGLGDNSSFSNKYAAKDHHDRNAKLGLGDNSSFSNKYAAKDYLDRNVKSKSIRKQLKHCDIRKVKTESTDETDDDVEILEDNEFLEDIRSFVPSKRIHKSMEEDADFSHRGRSSSSKSAPDGFRKEVLDVLGQPFDKDELQGFRESARDGSYYHYYPDLERKLKRCRYQRGKCLSILRGFFFWLQNLSKEGAFKPWKDGQCLAVEPAYPESSPPPPPSSARLDRGKAKLSKDSKPKIFK